MRSLVLMRLRMFAFAALTMAGLIQPVRADDGDAARRVRSAIESYRSGDFEKAQEDFALAELECPECPEIAYNRGLASYRQRDFSAAREHFSNALQTRDLSLEAKTKYNLGNVGSHAKHSLHPAHHRLPCQKPA